MIPRRGELVAMLAAWVAIAAPWLVVMLFPGP